MEITMKPRLNSNCFTRATAFVLLLLAAGCASAPPAPPVASLLTAAGFKTLAASTPQQQQHLKTLPADQITVVQRDMKTYFVYPDSANNQIYVGTEKEYQAYMRLRAQNNVPTPYPDAIYQKQDAQMRAADTRDASVSWGFWPAFSGLGWQ
jgi:hypothetical protein